MLKAVTAVRGLVVEVAGFSPSSLMGGNRKNPRREERDHGTWLTIGGSPSPCFDRQPAMRDREAVEAERRQANLRIRDRGRASEQGGGTREGEERREARVERRNA